jgi:hypothetical protein
MDCTTWLLLLLLLLLVLLFVWEFGPIAKSLWPWSCLLLFFIVSVVVVDFIVWGGIGDIIKFGDRTLIGTYCNVSSISYHVKKFNA